jgi:hypothetical protein
MSNMVFVFLHSAVWHLAEEHHWLNMKMYVWAYAGVPDHCMALREKAGGNSNLFIVEKRLRRLQKKHEKQSAHQSEQQKQEMNVFDFINSKLGGKRGLQLVHSCFIYIVCWCELLHCICGTR